MTDNGSRQPRAEIGVLGGTFNPVHNGHLRLAEFVLGNLELDEVRLVPANIPPHKNPPEISAEHRAAMVELAVTGSPGIVCDRRELGFFGPSFSVRTIGSLARDFPDAGLHLILGLDAFLGLPSWYRWWKIAELCRFVVVNRPGTGQPEPYPDWWQELIDEHGASVVEYLQMDPYDISATELRRRISNDESVDGLLPDNVIHYIRDNHLYV